MATNGYVRFSLDRLVFYRHILAYAIDTFQLFKLQISIKIPIQIIRI